MLSAPWGSYTIPIGWNREMTRWSGMTRRVFGALPMLHQCLNDKLNNSALAYKIIRGGAERRHIWRAPYARHNTRLPSGVRSWALIPMTTTWSEIAEH
jgi:hypothetical protein